ncbi:hypothetical protein [Limnobacter litoralis]|uniref:hypothetical protein n=1 Tax=Limnobacter litoralis TaxID=481366 RepID=UPI0024E05709|nr:hypothetical protein [Limnobacter litoralis]
MNSVARVKLSKSAGQQVSRSAGQQVGLDRFVEVPQCQALRVGVSRSAIQGCPAGQGLQLWNRPDLRHV